MTNRPSTQNTTPTASSTPSPSPSPTRSPTASPRRRRLLVAAASARGQATAEYALVMLAAAGLAGLLLAWATSTDGVARLMNAVLDSLIGDVQP